MNTTILIVDDDEKNRKLLKYILNNSGYNTLEVADGESALAEVKEKFTSPDSYGLPLTRDRWNSSCKIT